MKKYLNTLLLILVFLTACSTTEPTSQVFSASATSPLTPTQLPATQTPPPPSNTPDLPIETLAPSTTPTPQPSATATPTATLRPITEEIPGEILFSIYPDGDISIMDADGDNRQTLIDRPTDFSINLDRHASWLPDGSGISYTVDDFERAEIWRMDLDGSNPQLLIGEAATNSTHAWSPDGEMLAYVSTQNRIEIYHLADQTVQPLTDGRFRTESDPDWSPDGQKIAFTAVDRGNLDIYTIQYDGMQLTRITNHPDADQAPDWSPDGTAIVFNATRDGDHIQDLFVIELSKGIEEDGNTPQQLTVDQTLDVDPDWSPDGNYIVYAAHTFGASHATLFIIDALGQGRLQLTAENTYFSPKWRPLP